ncbi:hypothetical protein N3K66_001704 [Trichothecium roseum]|uniref:Uncharacterized protein n=1 Tax=Trichothecium roseum TaxID=47278 RepID=A0ACC0V7I0_9HYPO|nr:hypothetical protein N3K66_001704 [Trichothecium roseum]
MSATLRQFARFSTDAYGLERLLRLIQAALQIIQAYPLAFSLLVSALSLISPETSVADGKDPGPGLDPATLSVILTGLRNQMGVWRRVIRLFRFIESFAAAQALYSAAAAGSLSLTAWLGIFSHSFNGMYFALEAVTLLDVLGIPGLSPWGAEYGAVLKIESQRSWLFALVSGALAGLLQVSKLRANRSAVLDEQKRGEEKKKEGEAKVATGTGRGGSGGVDEEAVKVKAMDAQIAATSRKVTANLLDLVLPGAVLGWIPAAPGTVGLAMFATSLITGYDVWLRCGREVGNAKRS